MAAACLQEVGQVMVVDPLLDLLVEILEEVILVAAVVDLLEVTVLVRGVAD